MYDSALFWSWGSDRGPDTIYLMLVTHTQWDGLSGKTFILFQCLPSGAPGPLSFSCVFKKNMGIYFPSLFGRGEFIASSPILIRHYVSSCKKLSDQCRAFFINSFSSFLLLRGVSGRVVTWLIGWRLNLMDASRGWNITCCPL